MGKKGSSSKKKKEEEREREGENLLGKPKFKKIENNRYRCIETGHEVPNNDEAKAAYSLTKHCRIGLIDSALSLNKPPLNIFRQHPNFRLKLICQLTGDTINKSEEHIWKHINGKRFLNMLEKKEAEKEAGGETVEVDKPKEDLVKEKKKKKKEKEKKKKKKKGEGEEKKKEGDRDIGKDNGEMMNSSDKECNSENGDFWMPPVGERWDMDDEGERWSSGSHSDAEFEHDVDVANAADDAVDDESKEEARELSKRTKRMAVEIEPSSLASRKKKKKKKNEAPE